MPGVSISMKNKAALLVVSLGATLGQTQFVAAQEIPIMEDMATLKKTPIWVEKANGIKVEEKKAEISKAKDLDGKADFGGRAAFYSSDLHGKRTASGQPYDETKLTAAHKHLPFGTKVTVVNRKNGKTCTLTINDRGPYAKDHVIDVSKAAAKELGLMSDNRRMVDCYIKIDPKGLRSQPLKDKVKVAESMEEETL